MLSLRRAIFAVSIVAIEQSHLRVCESTHIELIWRSFLLNNQGTTESFGTFDSRYFVAIDNKRLSWIFETFDLI